MSDTNTQLVQPLAFPPVASNPKADMAITISKTLSELVAFANANPELMAYLQKQFGQYLLAAVHTTAGSFLGMALGWLFAQFGQTPNPTLTLSLCGGGVLLGSALWNAGVMLYRKVKG